MTRISPTSDGRIGKRHIKIGQRVRDSVKRERVGTFLGWQVMDGRLFARCLDTERRRFLFIPGEEVILFMPDRVKVAKDRENSKWTPEVLALAEQYRLTPAQAAAAMRD